MFDGGGEGGDEGAGGVRRNLISKHKAYEMVSGLASMSGRRRRVRMRAQRRLVARVGGMGVRSDMLMERSRGEGVNKRLSVGRGVCKMNVPIWARYVAV